MSDKVRNITIEEWERYEWTKVGEGEYLKGLMKTEVPPMPQDGYKYELLDLTSIGDIRRVLEWVRVKVHE